MENNVKTATVKKDGRKVKVYKLNTGKWNIYFGDDITLAKVYNNEHSEQFDESELKFD